MNPLWPEKIGNRLCRRHKNPKGGDILWLNPPLRNPADALDNFGITEKTPLHLIVITDYLPEFGPGYDPDDFSVIANEVDIGRISNREPANRGWGWFQSCYMGGELSGNADTLDEAKAAFAERFRRWLRTGR